MAQITGRAVITYSRKVFIPLTRLCRDTCRYCTFAKSPSALDHAYLPLEEVLEIARAGAAAGCKEALFTLGDRPELRYAAARRALAALGFETTVQYLEQAARRVIEETGLLPHINAGVLDAEDYARLRPVAASMGLMLESAADRLCAPGGPHHGCPDKIPAVRLASIAAAGVQRIPFTSGILIGIGETRDERVEALKALRALHRDYGHIQEVIIQNFRAKPDTKMADAAEPDLQELLWTIAAAREIFGDEVSIQAPPNLNPGRIADLIAAGIDDWGGISPVTIDHVNPEAAWPEIPALAAQCAEAGHVLAERLTIYPRYARRAGEWLAPQMRAHVFALADSGGLARDTAWSPGLAEPAPAMPAGLSQSSRHLDRCLASVSRGEDPSAANLIGLFGSRGSALRAVIEAADGLRREACGDAVTYVVNRNINYTNICTYRCAFCAFSKSSAKLGLRDAAYRLDLDEIATRVVEARASGATEVCLQGGIHPDFTGATYLEICRAVKRACPEIHVHAFSPLEIHHGARTLGLSAADFLCQLKDEGLGSLPGTAAEILCDDVRAIICPDKISTEEWLDIIAAAHEVGLPTTSTIMFGHVERHDHWAAHLLQLRRLQEQTGGLTEFVPLPFVHMQAPIFVKGLARKGPTWRESILMHAVSRIALHGRVANIQASWVKLGLDGAVHMLGAGANDLGGTLMNESISRAAGASHGQGLTVAEIERAVAPLGRPLRRRSTLYRALAAAA